MEETVYSDMCSGVHTIKLAVKGLKAIKLAYEKTKGILNF